MVGAIKFTIIVAAGASDWPNGCEGTMFMIGWREMSGWHVSRVAMGNGHGTGHSIQPVLFH